MSDNLINAYDTFTQEYLAKNNSVDWFIAKFKTHLSKNITLEDWNTLQTYLKNAISDNVAFKKLLDKIYVYLVDDVEEYIKRTCILDAESTNVNFTLKNNTDYTFSNPAITNINITIPATISHGFLGTFSIKINSSTVKLSFNNNSTYPVYYIKNSRNVECDKLELISHQTLLGSVICDGINCYVNLKELADKGDS